MVEALDLDRPEADPTELAWSSDNPLSRDEEASENRDLDDFFDLLDAADVCDLGPASGAPDGQVVMEPSDGRPNTADIQELRLEELLAPSDTDVLCSAARGAAAGILRTP